MTVTPIPPDQSLTGPTWLTVVEVAARLRVSRMTVYRLVHSGELPAAQVGRSYRISEPELIAFLAAAHGHHAQIQPLIPEVSP